MSTSIGQSILTSIRDQLNIPEYQKIHWEGSFEEYLDIVQRTPRGDPHRLRAAVRHDPVARHRRGVRVQGKDRPLPLLHRVRHPPRRRHLRHRQAVDAARQRLQVGRPRLRHRAPRAAAARAGRQLQEHHRPRPQARHRGLLAHRRGHAVQLRAGRTPTAPGPRTRCTASRCNSSRSSTAPPSSPSSTRAGARTTSSVRVKGEMCPYSRFIFNERLAKYKGDWIEMLRNEVKVYRLVLSEKDRIGIGTFQPKDEKNNQRDSTELTGDINYRKIAEYGTDSRPARLQFRRRAEHRQPRHRRVHRGAEARRGVPLRPARREPGTQDQAEEVRPDGHRRGHSGPQRRGADADPVSVSTASSGWTTHGEAARALRR